MPWFGRGEVASKARGLEIDGGVQLSMLCPASFSSHTTSCLLSHLARTVVLVVSVCC